MLLEVDSDIFSKCQLKSLKNQAGFDSAIRRFDPSRPSQLSLALQSLATPIRAGEHCCRPPTSFARMPCAPGGTDRRSLVPKLAGAIIQQNAGGRSPE